MGNPSLVPDFQKFCSGGWKLDLRGSWNGGRPGATWFVTLDELL